MFPRLSNIEFFIFLLMLWSLWFYLSTLHDIRQWRGEEKKKKGQRRRLKPQTPHDCDLCQKGVQLEPKANPRQVTPWSEIKNPVTFKNAI